VDATGNHPFWVIGGDELDDRPEAHDVSLVERELVSGGRWVEARDLKVGDKFISRGGESVTVSAVSVTYGQVQVFNIEVDVLHNYAVSQFGILVHNKSMPNPNPGVPDSDYWKTPQEWAKADANDALKKAKQSGVGTGARSGQHGKPYNQAAAELRRKAKEAKDRGDLPEYVDGLLEKARQFDQKAREINHKM
jgi:hypothetical protein